MNHPTTPDNPEPVRLSTKTPSVSVIVLNRNGRNHIEPCLSSLLETNFPQDKLAIVLLDSGSSDDSVKVVQKRFPQVAVVKSKFATRSLHLADLAAMRSTADYLALLTDRMKVDRNWLQPLIDEMDPENNIVFTCSSISKCDRTEVDAAGDACSSGRGLSNGLKDHPFESVLRPLLVPPAAMLIDKTVLAESVYIDPAHFGLGEDTAFRWRLLLRGYRCKMAPASVVYYTAKNDSEKPDQAYTHRVAQVTALSTLFNNLEAEHLKRLLPFFLYYLIEQAMQNSEDRQSLPSSFEEFLNSIDPLIIRRHEIQSSRVKSDLQIFIEAGHPLGFLTSANWNETSRRELEAMGLGIDFDCGNAGELKRELRRLIAAVHLKYAEQTALENQLLRREVTRLQNESQRLSVEIERRSTDAARLLEERESLAQELQRIKSSRGWRALSRYGRIKYRYLLPIYRLLGLGESESAASESARRRQSQEPLNPVSPAPASNISKSQSGERAPQSGRTALVSSDHISDARPLAVENLFEGYRSHRGYCNVCGSHTAFFYRDEGMYRESLTCAECLTTSRYRSIARGVLRAVRELRGIDARSLEDLRDVPGIAKLSIYDTQSPFYLPISAYPLPDILTKSDWIEVRTSIYRPEEQPGAELGENISNQNLETLSFDNQSFDIVITSDVMEHVRLDGLAHREIARVLKPGGVYLFTVPHFRHKRETLIRVAAPDPSDSSKDVFILTKEYHGDANSESGRALAYRTYGLDLDEKLQELGFTVDYECRDYPEAGILNTELFFCRFKQV